MDSFNDFIHMGGYAAYVWSSYAIALVAFIWSVASPLIEKRKLEKRIRRIVKNESQS